MKISIGFRSENLAAPACDFYEANKGIAGQPVRSLVDIRFPARSMTLTYYNDRFDLAPGDLVYVDGKLEGLLGHVVSVNRHFKIKLSDYKRVIAKVDTRVQGQLNLCGSHVVSFDRHAIPYSKVIRWFKAPVFGEEEYVSGEEGGGFLLEDLSTMEIRDEIAERGHDYYVRNKVSYICLDGIHGKAIVEGSEPYELEFDYVDGEVSNLVCNCYCFYRCKHEFAAMLQLSETLAMIEKYYDEQYAQSGYFAALSKSTFMTYVLNHTETGTFSFF